MSKLHSLGWKKLFVLPVALLLSFSFAGCRVEQTDSGELPDVDINVDAGELPEYEVEGPDVTVGETEITVPTVDVDLPDGDDTTDGD